MWVNAYEFSLFLNICDNVVDGYLSSGSCSGRYCDDRNARLLGWSNTLKTSYILELRVCDNDTDCLGSIHRRSTTDCDNVISAGILECLHTMLYILNGWVCFNIRINLICKSVLVKDIGYLLGYSEFDQIRVRADKCLLESTCLRLCCDLLDSPCTMIRCFI